MKLTGNIALALVAVVLLAVGAVGFADKTEELAAKENPTTQEHQMDDGSTMDGMDHGGADEDGADAPAPEEDQSDEGDMGGMDHEGMEGIDMEGMGH